MPPPSVPRPSAPPMPPPQRRAAGGLASQSLRLDKERVAIEKAKVNLNEKQDALLETIAYIERMIDGQPDERIKKKFKKSEQSKPFKCKKSKRSKKKVPKKPPKKKPTLSKMMKSTPPRSPKKSKRPRRSKCGGRPKKSRRR